MSIFRILSSKKVEILLRGCETADRTPNEGQFHHSQKPNSESSRQALLPLCGDGTSVIYSKDRKLSPGQESQDVKSDIGGLL